jgi:Fe-S oxidoreductase
MRAQQRGAMPVSDTFVRHISACLDCRGCESACPSGVPYGELVEKAREVIEHHARRGFLVERFRKFIFAKVFRSPRLLRFSFDLLRFYQRAGLRSLLRARGLLKMFPGHLAELEELLPDIRQKHHHVKLGSLFPAEGERRSRVALLTGCVMNEVFGDVNQATIRVLQKNGCDVIIPAAQRCCGALHCHAGLLALARDMARQNIVAFEETRADAVITNASGCGAKLKEYGMLLADDPQFATRATAFSGRVQDIASFLDSLPDRKNPKELKLRVAYDDPCHLLHAMKVSRAPRNMLRSIPGLELVELATPEQCCGSAGIYNITHYELSMRILQRKVDDIKNSGAEVLVTGNPGCMIQIAYGLGKAGVDVRVMHLAELLDEALS